MDWANKALGEENEMYSELPFKDGISYGLSALSNGNVQMLLAIFTAIFITSEFSHGTMKNVVSKGFLKLQIFFSKLITMIIAVYIIILANIIVGTLSATIVTGTVGDFTGEFVGEMLKTVGIELLLNAALAAVFVMVAMVIRNLGGAIAVSILGVLTLAPLIYTALEVFIKSKIDFTEFSLLFNIMFYINETAAGSDYLRSSIVGIIFIVATTALGIFAFKKSDVK
jgi:ABC-2 type transport system permease protein